MKFRILTASLICFFSICLSAQRGWEVGGGAGVAYYFGDLNTNFDLSRPGWVATGVARYNFNKRLNLKFSANVGRVSADDALSKNAFERARNLSFRSMIYDGAAQLEFNFFPYHHGSPDQYYTPYLFLGASIFAFNPQAELRGDWINLQPLGTEGQDRGDEYFRISQGLVYGAGFKIDITSVWSLNFEFSGRQLATDFFDDVSGVYPNPTTLLNQRGQDAVDLSDRSIPDLNTFQIGEPGRQRGNSRDNDSYNFFTVTAVYYLGRLQCPAISNF
ncbi:MAG: DUF6089 family protein [Bacteroidota bacterium]